MNNQKYWEKFYKKFKVTRPSDFAKFCLKYFTHGQKVIDLGCGNGRDSYYFVNHGLSVIGIDMATCPKYTKNAIFFTNDFTHYDSFIHPVYGRFFLHSISNEQISYLFSKARNMLLLEFRDKADHPMIYKHLRNHVDGNTILKELVENNFDILFYQKSKGLAKFRNEDPLICRVIAKRK